MNNTVDWNSITVRWNYFSKYTLANSGVSMIWTSGEVYKNWKQTEKF